MTLRHCTTSQIFWREYDYRKHKYTNWVFNPKFVPSKEDTYIAIAGPSQHEWLEEFEKYLPTINGKIVFRSAKALNTNYLDTGPRNTLIVFEFD